MLDEPMMPSPRVFAYPQLCHGLLHLGNDVWLAHVFPSDGSGEFVDAMSLEAMFFLLSKACSSSSDVHFLACLILSLEEPLGFNMESESMMEAFSKPGIVVES